MSVSCGVLHFSGSVLCFSVSCRFCVRSSHGKSFGCVFRVCNRSLFDCAVVSKINTVMTVLLFFLTLRNNLASGD